MTRTDRWQHPLGFLLLLPLFFVWHGYTEHYPAFHWADVWTLVPVYWAAALVLTALAWLWYRNLPRAALLAVALLAIHFFFGSFHDFLRAQLGERLPARYTFLLPALLGAAIAWAVYLRRSKANLERLCGFLNVLLLALLVLDGVQRARARTPQQPEPALAGFQPCDSCSRPDIYLVLTDGYAGSGAFDSALHADNHSFYDALRQRGFYLVPHTHSNYNYTPFSMASLLNLGFVQGIDNRYTLAAEKNICYPLINHNVFAATLGRLGYELRNYSIFEMQGERPPSFSPFFRTPKEIITGQTLGSRLNRDVRFNLSTRLHWRSELKRYARYEVRDANERALALTLEESNRTSSRPRFVYTHLMLPHDPYFYREDGSENPVEVLADFQKTNPALYLSYLRYGNHRLLELIDGIRRNNRRPAIILLLSDHGYRGTNHFAVSPELQFSNINAIFLPDGRYQGWYPGISNVNHLRALLNTEFGQRLPLLRDSTSYLVE